MPVRDHDRVRGQTRAHGDLVDHVRLHVAVRLDELDLRSRLGGAQPSIHKSATLQAWLWREYGFRYYLLLTVHQVHFIC